jgi:hypothetical protein
MKIKLLALALVAPLALFGCSEKKTVAEPQIIVADPNAQAIAVQEAESAAANASSVDQTCIDSYKQLGLGTPTADDCERRRQVASRLQSAQESEYNRQYDENIDNARKECKSNPNALFC